MIDTIVIGLDFNQFKITNPTFFEPRLSSNFYYQPYVEARNNPPKAEQKKDYRPRMTLLKRPYMGGTLKIEFSVPNILFQNGLDEVEEKHFDNLINELQRKLEQRGVKTSKKALINACVFAFHPSKNIELSGYTTATMVIRDLAKANISRRFDQDHKDYRNGGHALQYYTKAHSLVFYDKIADMIKSDAKAISDCNTLFQKSLFRKIEKMRTLVDIEIMKMEVRLTQKKKINSVLRDLGYKENPTIKDIFKKDVCQKVLIDYWQQMIFEKSAFILTEDQKKEKELFEMFSYAKENRHRINEALIMFAVNRFGKETGLPVFRRLIEDFYGKNAWARMPKRIKALNSISKANNFETFQKSYVKDIEKTLFDFEPLKKEQFNNAFGLLKK